MHANNQHEEIASLISRRTFFTAIGGAAAALAWSYFHWHEAVQAAASAAQPAGSPKLVKIVQFTDAGQRQDTVTVPKIVKTDEEWRKQLSPESFEITRHAGIERPYSNENPNNHAKGIFRCICCDTALFDASTKFASGWRLSGAPNAKENCWEEGDTSRPIIPAAVPCRLGDAHLGHVFDDGPR